MLITKNRHHEYRVPVYASSYFSSKKDDYKQSIRKIDEVHKAKTVATVNGKPLDYSWLRGAAETYHLSPNIEDYILTEVPAVTVGIPNRNLHAFPYEEVTYFDPKFGRFVYQTFIGKCTFVDHCFPAGTQITMADGSTKPIEEINVGDEVITHNLKSKKVTETFKNGKKSLMKIKIQGVMDDLELTSNHPVYVVAKQQVYDCEYTPHWREADDLYVGDYLCIPKDYTGKMQGLSSDSTCGIVTDKYLLMPILKIEKDVRTADVYNFEVEDDHTYIANNVVVHNCNKNPIEAKGIIFDASLRKVPGWDVWKIYTLLGYDRTKDAALAKQIERGTRRSYSMGAWVSYFINSITGQIENNSPRALKYPKGTVVSGRLSYQLCAGVDFFEMSSVDGPADVCAESHQLWYF